MTTRKHLKRRVRTRSAETGEPYATALRILRQEQEKPLSTPMQEVIASCSFCGKPNTEVQRIVAGPGVYICNECIDLSAAIVEEASSNSAEESARRRSDFLDRSTEDLIASLPALLRSADRVESELRNLIGRLRSRGVEWDSIARTVDMTAETARRRFAETDA